MAYAQAEPQAYPSPAERQNPRARSSSFVLGTVDSSSMLAALGLQTGDVPISLGRRRLDSVDDLMAAFMSLPNALSFTLYIERAGTQMTLQYQVQ